MKKGVASVLWLCALALPAIGCTAMAPKLAMNIQTFEDPAHVPLPGSTFQTVVTHANGNDLMEKELLAAISARLQQKGLRPVADRPDFYVMVITDISSSARYVPPATLYIPTYGTSTSTTTTTGTVGNVPFSGTSTTTTPTNGAVPITMPGKTVTEYHRIIDLVLARPTSTDGEAKVEEVWRGIVDSTGRTGDLLYVSPYLLDELFAEFPRRSGRGPDREVPFAPPRQ